MKMVMNIIRFSSFSIAKTSLGTTGYRSTPTKNLKPATDSDMVIDDELPQPQFSGNQRSEKLQSSSKPRSARNGDVNGMFAAYIRKCPGVSEINFSR
ncbi:hypothetical protein EPI10_003711 [Gossypium australe]|uniref:Uncharacterized protein n=1 Tax=Gossypium australe TaxID=47621 RepID=A0A5B6UKI7_9ROSI|nr:hypothetical protein EPI10_003711 [Gossypium australe]